MNKKKLSKLISSKMSSLALSPKKMFGPFMGRYTLAVVLLVLGWYFTQMGGYASQGPMDDPSFFTATLLIFVGLVLLAAGALNLQHVAYLHGGRDILSVIDLKPGRYTVETLVTVNGIDVVVARRWSHDPDARPAVFRSVAGTQAWAGKWVHFEKLSDGTFRQLSGDDYLEFWKILRPQPEAGTSGPKEFVVHDKSLLGPEQLGGELEVDHDESHRIF